VTRSLVVKRLFCDIALCFDLRHKAAVIDSLHPARNRCTVSMFAAFKCLQHLSVVRRSRNHGPTSPETTDRHILPSNLQSCRNNWERTT